MKQNHLATLGIFGTLVLRDAWRRNHNSNLIPDWRQHLDATVEWLCHAQDVTYQGGVSYGYSLKGGWRAPYVETTGYIAETFFALAGRYPNAGYLDRAVRMLSWLCSNQNQDGSFGNACYQGGNGIVFDTGQDLHGLVTGYLATGEDRFLDYALRSGRWLVGVADSDNRWTHNTYLARPHAYNTRVAWALLRLNMIEAEHGFKDVAVANLNWATAMETEGGYQFAAFRSGVPYTHTLAYTIRGLLEAGLLTGNAHWFESAQRVARATARHLTDDGFLPALIDQQGRTHCRWCCLTGNVQMAVIWARIAQYDPDCHELRESALRATEFVLRTQVLSPRWRNIRGGIKGSQPIWGGYSPLTYPNWAAKFLVDALLELH